ncbi:MAG TPA: Asp-tRNA(Asn)/Glu-tRNA(Gln) amidotransferase subunit GatC [Chthoniobacterales bacterium]|jgi:aspartyl-tRNA(Asn)/glutamyl-tRNA(Gln) amidotransferase subunit C|nr:Asp-tRNA(Asn)/Glu-tRNA(Gln) amidotransferase subunit GatC [Chthoniobacterales bacterium]
MAKSTELDVGYVSKLARLNLGGDETKLFQKQLADVLKYAEKLSEVDVSQVEAAAHAVPMFNVFREDEPGPCFTADEALANAPQKANQLFVVPKVVE